MNLLLVLTGGTICTSVRDGLRSLDDEHASLQLVEEFRRSNSPFADSVRFTVGARFHTLSENMTVDVWNRISDYLRSVRFADFDGVLIAHGTDTLAYTSSMFALLLAGIAVPVVFVSSNAPLEHGDARANGAANFRAAVECIARGLPPGVYVTYRNVSDRRMYLHNGARLNQCGDYSEDFHSVGALDITDAVPDMSAAPPLFDAPRPVTPLSRQSDAPSNSVTPLLYQSDAPRFVTPPRQSDAPSNSVTPLLYQCGALSDRVLSIRPYVGLRYDAFRVEQFRAVLHGTYHSGTARAGDPSDVSSILYLFDRCADANTDLYLSPAWTRGELYDTVPVILRHSRAGKRIVPLHGMTFETAYCKLLLAYSCPDILTRFPDFLTCNFLGERIE